MNLNKALLLAFPLSLATSLGSTALARTIELKILPFNGPELGCPEQLIAYETPRPRSPGGYATDGMIHLAPIATDIIAATKDDFSATWVGTLKPEFASCKATAGMSVIDGEANAGHSYLRVQLAGGRATVILDMTGMPDTNSFTATLLEQTLRDGNPRWAWGGTD